MSNHSDLKSKDIKEIAKNVIWPIEEQTKVKHELLRNYISKWIAILFSQQERMAKPKKLVYIDGFSGPGVYWRDKTHKALALGSPLIVANEAKKYIHNSPNSEFVIICLEKDSKSVAILNMYLELFNKYGQNWKAYPAEFDQAINTMLDGLEESGTKNAPIFFFIDPFGYTGFPMTTLKRILKYPLVELFINFNIYDVERFCHDENKDKTMVALFGCKDFIKARQANSSAEKYIFLKNLYCRRLQLEGLAKYVMPFRVNTPKQKARPRYYLIHASNHLKALKAMKDSMAQISDKPFAFEAIGISNTQTNLFEDPEKLTLKSKIENYLKSLSPNSISYEGLEDWAYPDTNGISKTIKQSLCELEEIDKTIKIKRLPSQQKTTVVKGAKIRYINQ